MAALELLMEPIAEWSEGVAPAQVTTNAPEIAKFPVTARIKRLEAQLGQAFPAYAHSGWAEALFQVAPEALNAQ